MRGKGEGEKREWGRRGGNEIGKERVGGKREGGCVYLVSRESLRRSRGPDDKMYICHLFVIVHHGIPGASKV